MADRHDLRLYRRSGRYETVARRVAEIQAEVAAGADTARGVECIAGKVVKYLLTQQGSDAFAPDYGGTALHVAQIAATHLPRLRLDVQADILRCVAYLSRAEQELPAGAERLQTVTLLGVDYDPAARSGGVSVRIEILTTRGNRALVALGNDGAGNG